MGCYNQLLAGQKPQMQPLQQLVEPPPAFQWQPCPPQVIFNPWMVSQYPPMGWMLPQLQLLPPGPTEESPWFQELVSNVSRKIKEVEAKADARDGNEKVVAPAALSAQEQRALRDALRKGEEDGLTVQQVFEELSKTYGRKKIDVWTKWFVANFERLYAKVFSNVNSVGAASPGGTGGTLSSNQAATRSGAHAASSDRLSWSSVITLMNEQMQSREEESGSEWEESESDDQGSAYHDRPTRTRNAPQPHVDATVNKQTARVGPKRQPVTEEDLRAMALYILEKGDDCETRPYSRPSWHEFAQRPQNLKRSLEAWINVPRAHSAAIDRYVKEYQREAAKSKMTPGVSSSAKQLPGGKISQKRGGDLANASGDSDGGGAEQPLLKRKKTSLAVDPEDIIDLTVEMIKE